MRTESLLLVGQMLQQKAKIWSMSVTEILSLQPAEGKEF